MKDICIPEGNKGSQQETQDTDFYINEGTDSEQQSDFKSDSTQLTNFNYCQHEHSSQGDKNFADHCTKRVLEQGQLSATYHLCRFEGKASTRKQSLRTRSYGSTSTNSLKRASLSQKNSSDSLSSIGNATEDDIFVENESQLSPTLNLQSINTRQSTDCAETMGCTTSIDVHNSDALRQESSSLADEDSDDNKHATPSDQDVGLKTASNADLLQTQRLAPTDVTKGLAKRWLRSHFDEQTGRDAEKSAAGGKRRKGGKKTVSNSDLELHKEKKKIAIKPLPRGVHNRLSILHFNDVYEISERTREPVGGAARFATAMTQQVNRITQETGVRPLILFGGDCLNPSTLSCATQGEHMINVLNQLEVDVAVFGNHEFDFGAEHAVKCISKMNSVWLLSNVVDNLTGRNLVEGVTKHIVTYNNMKIGFVGLVEEEWLDTLATIEKDHLDFQDYVEKGRIVAAELRAEGADFVIALTHMRWPNDERLARLVPDVDLILGGHDHEYGVKEIDECLVIKSGSDFRNFSSVDVFMRDDGCVDVKLTRYDVTKKTKEDSEMRDIVMHYMSALEKSLDRKIGEVWSDLDGRFKTVRTQETRLGNFVADIMAAATRADIVLINSGTFRSDDIHKRGEFRLDDLMKILPISDTVVTIEVTGKQLLEALENGVSKYPKREGRFPQVSNICFGFNPEHPPGHRVIRDTIRIGGSPLDMTREYTVATKAYVARGKDGYECLKNCKLKTDPDSGPLLSTVVRNHVKNVFKLLEFERRESCKVFVSEDGRKLSTNNNLDPHQAFVEVGSQDDETPLAMIQRSMGYLDDVNNNKTGTENLNNETKILHTPNFISYASSGLGGDASYVHKGAELRHRVLSANGDEENLRLLKERDSMRKPELELRWQVLPLLEARIFHCKSLDG
uniref:Apyrase-like n=1 Tax=Phallusia mammillata TaxID=59560 RepID=A0A6F9DCK1_9ASCI|nr:apyrase-like [Phallusia mammillata]